MTLPDYIGAACGGLALLLTIRDIILAPRHVKHVTQAATGVAKAINGTNDAMAALLDVTERTEALIPGVASEVAKLRTTINENHAEFQGRVNELTRVAAALEARKPGRKPKGSKEAQKEASE